MYCSFFPPSDYKLNYAEEDELFYNILLSYERKFREKYEFFRTIIVWKAWKHS